MTSCWRTNPDERPRFSDLTKVFQEILKDKFAQEVDITYSPTSTARRRNTLRNDFTPQYLGILPSSSRDDDLTDSSTESENNTFHPKPPDLPGISENSPTATHSSLPTNSVNNVTHLNMSQNCSADPNLSETSSADPNLCQTSSVV